MLTDRPGKAIVTSHIADNSIGCKTIDLLLRNNHFQALFHTENTAEMHEHTDTIQNNTTCTSPSTSGDNTNFQTRPRNKRARRHMKRPDKGHNGASTNIQFENKKSNCCTNALEADIKEINVDYGNTQSCPTLIYPG